MTYASKDEAKASAKRIPTPVRVMRCTSCWLWYIKKEKDGKHGN